LDPDFYIGNGDNVYYDHPPTLAATTQEDMRAHWQRLFYMPRFRDLLSEVPVYWMMDDHDHRFNDSDTLNPHSSIGDDPSHELAMHTFAEQLPFTTGNWRETDFYRTVEMGNLLQVWMVEGRRYRSPNNQPDGTGKTLWGEEQIEWLKQSLLNSDAPFKILASPTPLIGPDDSYKNDNHTNPGGFRYERDAFFAWLKDNGFDDQHFYFICGDRHWKYHSIDPSGFEEYSCGALVDQNSRLGREPGDPKSTDPEGLIQQPFLDPVATGGFLHVAVETGSDSSHPTLTFSMFDDEGNLLYEDVKTSAASLVPGGKN
jgi:alkaline phosphatase/alkaline phosphatase D